MIVLGLAMFVMVVDVTVMNVSISAVVKDLGTTVSNMQLAIVCYALVMSSLMILGGKLGDKWGSKKTFYIGMSIYGVGTLLTGLSHNFAMLFLSWPILEGIGSALIMPAINVLVGRNFEGKMRALAYGVMGGVAASGAAFGPIVGGYFTTFHSWRWVFFLEFILVLVIFASYKLLQDPEKPRSEIKIDGMGVFLSVFGLVLLVVGISSAGAFGWITANAPFVFLGTEIIFPFNLSLALVLMIIGITTLGLFLFSQHRREKQKKEPLVSMIHLKNTVLKAGLGFTFFQSIVQAGALFAVPLFLQLQLGYTALQSGLTILPLSVALFLCSVLAPRFLSPYMSPRSIIQSGLSLMLIGSLLLSWRIEVGITGLDLFWGLLIMGAGIGLLMSQVVNLILGSVESRYSSEASALNGTFDQVGNSFGTAIIGSVLISFLFLGTTEKINKSTVFSSEEKPALMQAAKDDMQLVSIAQAKEIIEQEPPEIQQKKKEEILRIYQSAQAEGFKGAFVITGFFALGGILISFTLPRRRRKEIIS